ncbi:MAG: hypothetical protein Udaeo2_28510 [Candidatus Udaeobacter sp.]|nr:MAG: hypothetical protein Udaeo2_28510 [Candidatus Udaeobacter sp.]
MEAACCRASEAARHVIGSVLLEMKHLLESAIAERETAVQQILGSADVSEVVLDAQQLADLLTAKAKHLRADGEP